MIPEFAPFSTASHTLWMAQRRIHPLTAIARGVPSLKGLSSSTQVSETPYPAPDPNRYLPIVE